jgi:hypothetical protein
MSKKIIQRIESIKEEIRQTPYHKGTEHHIGKLRAKIAKLKQQLQDNIERESKKGGGGGYAIKKQGDATVILIGPPSVGKSTLLNRLTDAKSKVGEYDFTTLDVIPGMYQYKGANIQLLDVPGLITGAAAGKGNGKQILSVARNTDLIVLIADVNRLSWLEKARNELYEAGIRLDTSPPKVEIEKTVKGGINIIYPYQNFQKNTIKEIAKELGFKNAKITIKEELSSIQRLVDSFSGDKVYLPSLEVINKSDLKKIDSKKILTISAEKNRNVEVLKERIWNKLSLIRVYLKPSKGQEPDLRHPLILNEGDTVRKAVQSISDELLEEVDEIMIWGEEAKYPGQKVSLLEPLFDEAILYFKK